MRPQGRGAGHARQWTRRPRPQRHRPQPHGLHAGMAEAVPPLAPALRRRRLRVRRHAQRSGWRACCGGTRRADAGRAVGACVPQRPPQNPAISTQLLLLAAEPPVSVAVGRAARGVRRAVGRQTAVHNTHREPLMPARPNSVVARPHTPTRCRTDEFVHPRQLQKKPPSIMICRWRPRQFLSVRWHATGGMSRVVLVIFLQRSMYKCRHPVADHK